MGMRIIVCIILPMARSSSWEGTWTEVGSLLGLYCFSLYGFFTV